MSFVSSQEAPALLTDAQLAGLSEQWPVAHGKSAGRTGPLAREGNGVVRLVPVQRPLGRENLRCQVRWTGSSGSELGGVVTG